MNKIIYILLTIITFGCISITTNAEEAKDLIVSSGDFGCGKWISDKDEKRGKGLYTLMNKHWVRGYLTGAAFSTRGSFLKDTDDDSLMVWIDNYCQKNPLATVGEASLSLSVLLKLKYEKKQRELE